jgi:hypothetical protein
MRRRKRLIALLVAAGVFSAATAWSCRPRTFSYTNYQRIRPGMTLAEVEALLGGPGEEIRETQVPEYSDRKRVVSGERFFRSEQKGRKIIVSFEAGTVKEKWYWQPSL